MRTQYLIECQLKVSSNRMFQVPSNSETSNGKANKRMEVYRVDKDLWMCRIKASQMQLDETRNEIFSLVNHTIESY